MGFVAQEIESKSSEAGLHLFCGGGEPMAGKHRREPKHKPPWGALNFVVNLGRLLLEMLRWFVHPNP